MSSIKNEMIAALNKSVKDLQQGIDMHTCLIASILGHEVDTRNLSPLLGNCPMRTRETMLRDAVRETIETLEETRKAFKSKQLEVLRKRLIQVMMNLE